MVYNINTVTITFIPTRRYGNAGNNICGLSVCSCLSHAGIVFKQLQWSSWYNRQSRHDLLLKQQKQHQKLIH